MIKALLVDDEEKSRKALETLLLRYCPDVEISGQASGVEDAIAKIDTLKPDLVFMDVMMPDGNGFDVLERCIEKSFGVIFVSAFEQHAMRAFQFAALHYLLKPLNFMELQAAVDRFRTPQSREQLPQQAQRVELARRVYGSAQPESIVLHAVNGFSVAKISDILRCEADSNYTKIVFTETKPFMASRSLSHFEELLTGLPFVRVHHKHLINLAQVKRYNKGRGGYVEMSNGHEIEVSVRKKDEFLMAMANFARGAL
jgi:two-component system LytT family response regulator